MFAGLTALLAVPFLSPCGHSLILAGVDIGVPNDVVIRLGDKSQPPKELRKWAAIPLPASEVMIDSRLSRASLVTEADLGSDARQASHRGAHEVNAFGLVHDALLLAALTDPIGMSLMANSSSNSTTGEKSITNAAPHEAFTSRSNSSDRKRCLVISSSPYIEISAPNLKYTTMAGKPTLALASGGARITVITPQGSYYAISSKLHYRASDNAVILEGSPLIKTGTRYYAAKTQTTLLRIDLRNNHFSANGPMHMQADVTGHN